MHLFRTRYSGDKGAMIVQTAVASIAFLALAALAVDYGIKLIARTEAQRSADAGALAGAVALAFDDSVDLTESGIAKRSAQGYALANSVFGQAPDVQITSDVTFIECPPPDGGPGTTCVRVDVYRNQLRNNALPTFFSRLVGVIDQGVQATATAKVLSADTTDCLRPWAVIDRWDEYLDATDPDYPAVDDDYCPGGPNCAGLPPSTYDKYSDDTGQNPAPENDYYVPPATDGSSPGTGFRVPDDVGKQFALKIQTNDGITSGWGLALDLPRADTTNMGASAYGDNIISCSRIPVRVNDPAINPCPTDPTLLGTWQEKVDWADKGCVRVQTGTMQGPTSSNVGDLVAKDLKAEWGITPQGTWGVINSCCSESPRIVPVAVFDIDNYLAMNPTGSGGVVRIVNIFGFFIEGMGDYDDATGAMKLKPGGKAVIGRLMKFSGAGAGSVTLHETASFSKIIVLVR